MFIQRQTGEEISGILDAGGTVEVCFGFPTMIFPITAYHYATPVSQVDTLDHIGVVFINREPTTIYDVGLKAVVEEPDGNMVTLNRIVDSVESGVDNLISFFPPYMPPAIPGKFKVTFSNDVYAGGQRDSTVAYFEHTDYTFAHDNLEVVPGGASRDDLFENAGLFTQYGTLILSNESGGLAKYVTFGLNNAADLHVPNAILGENDIVVYLYDADVDDDGVWEFTPNSGTFDDLAAGLVGLTVYQIKGTEGVDSLFSVPLASLNDPSILSVNLKPNHPYYLSLSYDGTAAGKGIMPSYSKHKYRAKLCELPHHSFAYRHDEPRLEWRHSCASPSNGRLRPWQFNQHNGRQTRRKHRNAAQPGSGRFAGKSGFRQTCSVRRCITNEGLLMKAQFVFACQQSLGLIFRKESQKWPQRVKLG
ncbi:MAG: hypothetical protein IPM36_22635 [Lewinellaceae bacterium]|nr:hypothetical protein [Lewinellaceae bacterium]